MDDRPETYGSFADEPQELGLKYWLKGGEVKVNKKTWYAHLNKRGWHYLGALFSRRYKVCDVTKSGHTYSTKHWINNEEQGIIHKFDWLIEKFWPIPSWSEKWAEEWRKLNEEN